MRWVKKLTAYVLLFIGFFTMVYYTWLSLLNLYGIKTNVAYALLPIAVLITLAVVLAIGGSHESD